MILIMFSLLVLIWEYDNRMANIPATQTEREKTLLYRMNAGIRYAVASATNKIKQWRGGNNES